MIYNRHIPKEVCQKALDVWGKNAQILMVLEEMSELQKEILKNIPDHTAEESLQQNEEPRMELLDILLGLLNVFHIGE